MHQKLRHQVKIHKISIEKKKKKINNKNMQHRKRKKYSPSIQGKGKPDLRERCLTIPR